MNADIIIDSLGGTKAVAELCEITPQSVSDWRVKGIPKARILYFKAIRPDLFDGHDKQKESSPAP